MSSAIQIRQNPRQHWDSGLRWTTPDPRPKAGGQGVAGSNPVSPTEFSQVTAGLARGEALRFGEMPNLGLCLGLCATRSGSVSGGPEPSGERQRRSRVRAVRSVNAVALDCRRGEELVGEVCADPRPGSHMHASDRPTHGSSDEVSLSTARHRRVTPPERKPRRESAASGSAAWRGSRTSVARMRRTCAGATRPRCE